MWNLTSFVKPWALMVTSASADPFISVPLRTTAQFTNVSTVDASVVHISPDADLVDPRMYTATAAAIEISGVPEMTAVFMISDGPLAYPKIPATVSVAN